MESRLRVDFHLRYSPLRITESVSTAMWHKHGVPLAGKEKLDKTDKTEKRENLK